MSLKAKKLRKALSKSAKKGFRGYPIATIALYGPDDKTATKVVASIVAHEDAEPDAMKKWYSDKDLRNNESILSGIKDFLAAHGARSVVMPDRIIGCPHEEGVDYPEGQECPTCPFWKGRDRWTGERVH
ncbi:hypothetical protein [Thioalkalivibrio thiocyanodenitrificans]|uniref:hypothetical protein n=1 Tax=Thioalkalivibrio thiocyanodenitrificans TaxID=243063 RepID=UPI0009FCE671|nr:hypothetical protein [Thioalkalivibrio thiocyanodenitrificans]